MQSHGSVSNISDYGLGEQMSQGVSRQDTDLVRKQYPIVCMSKIYNLLPPLG